MPPTLTRALLALMVASAAVVATSGQTRPTASAPAVSSALSTFDPTEKSIEELQRAMQTGQVTSKQLVEHYLARIDAYDQQGPALNAIKAVNPQAREAAAALDTERAARGARGPLHGIPVLVKDNYETLEMPTTAGSIALATFHPKRDAFLVQRLKTAGAVILGKTNMHELAAGITSVGSSFGLIKNPYDLSRNPGGSSGGTGAAVAANFAAVGMGSDTCGSIRNPASHNNLVGLRGTRGLSSRTGIVPLSSTQDIGGPIARSIPDLALVLDATVGSDPADTSTREGEGQARGGYRAALSLEALKGARVGVVRSLFGGTPEDQEVTAVVQKALDALKAAGAEVVDVVIPGLDELLRDSSLINVEFKFDLADYLAQSPDAPVRSLADILDRGLVHTALEANFRARNAVESRENDQARRARVKRVALRRAVEATLDEHRLVALSFPTLRRKPALLGEGQGPSNCQVSAASGLPALGLPAGFTDDGVPVGMELLGGAFQEAGLLSLGYTIEQSMKLRRAPFSTPPLIGGRRPPPRTTSVTFRPSITSSVATGGSATTGSATPASVSAGSTSTATGGPAAPARRAAGAAARRGSDAPEVVLELTYDESAAFLDYRLRQSSGMGDRLEAVWLHAGTADKPGAARHQLFGPSRATAGTLAVTAADRADIAAGRVLLRLYLRGVPGSAGDVALKLAKE